MAVSRSLSSLFCDRSGRTMETGSIKFPVRWLCRRNYKDILGISLPTFLSDRPTFSGLDVIQKRTGKMTNSSHTPLHKDDGL